MTSRKQNIENIADACSTAPYEKGKLYVHYRNNQAVYNISGSHPIYTGVDKPGLSQYTIDGMRLAARRYMAARKNPKRSTFDDIIKLAQARFAAEPPFRPGSDKTAPLFFTQGPLFFVTPSPAEQLSARIANLATAPLPELARLYAYEIGKIKPNHDLTPETRAAQDMADLIDDIASMRFGIGFYQAE